MNFILFLLLLIIIYKVYENINQFGCRCEKCGRNIKCNSNCPFCGSLTLEKNFQIDKEKIIEEKKRHYNYYEVLDDLDGVVVALMAKVAKSNGIVSSKEADFISSRYRELANLTGKDNSVIDIYETIFEREKDNLDNLEEFAKKLKELDEAPKGYILKILEELTDVDGDTKILDNIKEYMKFNYDNNSYYKILNSKPTDDWDTIQKNYEKLIEQYSYSELDEKKLPKDLLEYADKRLKEINEAYEALKKLKF